MMEIEISGGKRMGKTRKMKILQEEARKKGARVVQIPLGGLQMEECPSCSGKGEHPAFPGIRDEPRRCELCLGMRKITRKLGDQYREILKARGLE
jgi:hypothetical protein